MGDTFTLEQMPAWVRHSVVLHYWMDFSESIAQFLLKRGVNADTTSRGWSTSTCSAEDASPSGR